MAVLGIFGLLIFGLTCVVLSKEKKSDTVVRSSFDFLRKRFIRASALENSLKTSLSSQMKKETAFGSTSNYLGGFTMVALSVVCSVVFLGGCLICPKWKLRKTNLTESPDYAAGITSKDVRNCSVYRNRSADLEEAINRILSDNAIAHSNPCFSFDESSNDAVHERLQVPLPQVHKVHGSRRVETSRTFSKGDAVIGRFDLRTNVEHLVYENRQLQRDNKENVDSVHLNERRPARIPRGELVRRPIELASVGYSENYDLCCFYSNTQYLNRSPFAENNLKVKSFRQSRRTTILTDVGNLRMENSSGFEGRGQRSHYGNRTSYDMNDVAFKNLYAK